MATTDLIGIMLQAEQRRAEKERSLEPLPPVDEALEEHYNALVRPAREKRMAEESARAIDFQLQQAPAIQRRMNPPDRTLVESLSPEAVTDRFKALGDVAGGLKTAAESVNRNIGIGPGPFAVAETAFGLASGIGAFGVGLFDFGSRVLNEKMQQVAKEGPFTFGTDIAKGDFEKVWQGPSSPTFYTNALKDMNENISALTYEPSGAVAKGTMGAVGAVMSGMKAFSHFVAEGGQFIGLDPDKRELLAFGIEMSMLYGADKGLRAAYPKLRSTVSDFRNKLRKVESDADFGSPELLQVAEKLRGSAANTPETLAELNAARLRVTETLKAVESDLITRLSTVLKRPAEELVTTLNNVRAQPASNLAGVLQGRMKVLQDAMGEFSAVINERNAAKTPAEFAKLEERANAAYGRLKELEGKSAVPGETGISDALSEINPAVPPGTVETGIAKDSSLGQAIEAAMNPNIDPKVRSKALRDLKATARSGLERNQKTSEGLAKLGLSPEQISILEPELSKVRSGKIIEEAATFSGATVETASGGTVPTGGDVVAFQTSLGSTYEIGEGGITTRTKTPHPGHAPTDVGLKTPSERTIYVGSEEAAKKIGSIFAINREANPRITIEGNEIVLRSGYSPTEKLPNPRQYVERIPFTEKPEVGKHPVELWRPSATETGTNYSGVHAGNPIVSVETAIQKPIVQPKIRSKKPRKTIEVEPSVEAEPIAATEIPAELPLSPTEVGLPDYLQTNLAQLRERADNLGLTSEIQRLHSEGKVAREIVQQLNDKFPASMDQLERTAMVRVAREGATVRTLGEAQRIAETKAPQYASVGSLVEAEAGLKGGTFAEGSLVPSDVPIQIRVQNGKANAILVDPKGLNISSSVEMLQRQLELGKMSQEMFDLSMDRLRRQADVGGVPIEQAHSYFGLSFVDYAMRIAKENGLEIYQAKITKGRRNYEQVPERVVDTATGLIDHGGRGLKRIDPEAAAEYVAFKTANLGDDVITKIQDSLVNGTDITPELPAQAVPHYKRLFEKTREGLETNQRRGLFDILSDLNTLLGEAGTLGRTGLSTAQKLALNNLRADAARAKVRLEDWINRQRIPEAEKILFYRHLEANKSPLPPSGVGPRRANLYENASATDPVVDQRVRRTGEIMPPKFKSEVDAIQNAVEIRKAPDRITETPVYVFREAQVSDLLLPSYRLAERNVNRATAELNRDLKALTKTISPASAERIGAYGYSLDPRGRMINHRNGVQTPTLTANEMTVWNAMREMFDDAWVRINEAREFMGKDPIPYINDYMTFMRSYTLRERVGAKLNLLHDSAANIMQQHTVMTQTSFPYSRFRKKANYSAEYNVSEIMQNYMRAAEQQVHLSPFIAKLHELIQTKLPDPTTGEKTWMLREEKPKLYEALKNWQNYLATGSNLKLPAIVETPMKVAMRNMGFAQLSWNAKTAIANLGSLLPTWHMFGTQALMDGLGRMMRDVLTRDITAKQFRMKESNVLDTRHIDLTYNDYVQAVLSGRPSDIAHTLRRGEIGKIQSAVGDLGYKGIKMVDGFGAELTWDIGYKFAKEKLNFDHVRAKNFADDSVVMTQGSSMPGDLAAAQRSTLGRFFTQFQSYVITDYNYITRNVLGYKGHIPAINELPARNFLDIARGEFHPIKSALRFSLGVAAFNVLFEDIIGIQSPLPTPIRDVERGIQQGDNSFELAYRLASGLTVERLPGLGAYRYGKSIGGPAVETIDEFVRSAQGAPLSHDIKEPTSKLLGVPGAQQYWKMKRAEKRGEPFWQSLMGWYSQEDGGRSRRTRRERSERSER